jgi:hypothetical protein
MNLAEGTYNHNTGYLYSRLKGFEKSFRSQAEKALESAPAFKHLKTNTAIESSINELEHRGLDRCPDRTQDNFKRYVGLAITAYNLHNIS